MIPSASEAGPAGFAAQFSIEATRLGEAEIAAIGGLLPPATEVYLSAVPTLTAGELVTAAAGLA